MSSLTRRIFKLEVSNYKQSLRNLSFSNYKSKNSDATIPTSMSAWQISGYNGIQSLKLANFLEIPPLTKPNEVLVEVQASSVNVLDVMMTGMFDTFLISFNK